MVYGLGLAKQDLWGLGAESWFFVASHDSAPRPQRSLFVNMDNMDTFLKIGQ